MKIITPSDFFQTFKDTYILLDTSVFIDAFLNPVNFSEFFNNLRMQGVILVSLDAVKIEFLKGAPTAEKYHQKEEFFNQIIDTNLPMTGDTLLNLYQLVRLYKEDGKSLSITDLLLGATLMQYKKGLFLLTKNTTDFPTNIFNLKSYINISYTKGLHTYGVYNII
ncbi:MAG: type II toxin-antitoxin system VapC family toxin [Candidatus Levybacteria bacterium]|nr:type II toxin-antitoxin system VapC family toxin [Candidatus Levybacteria bacterium]